MRKPKIYIWMAIAALSSTALAQPVGRTTIRLGSEGEILAWIVSGPFANENGTGLTREFLAGEAETRPSEGGTWKLALADRLRGLDLRRILGGKPGVAYCYTQIQSAAARKALLLFGSDDGARVWLNGHLIFEKKVARAVKRDDERVEIHLRKGTNHLLFKIEQGTGDWGLLARITDLGSNPVQDLTQSQTVLLEDNQPAPGEGWIRRVAGLTGALDLEKAVAYDTWNVKAVRWLERFRDEAADPDRLALVLQSQQLRVERGAAADANTLTLELDSARRVIERDYHRAREPLLRWAQNPGPLVASNVAAEDYLRVMPEGRYFQHSNGKPFIPIGYNHNPDWTEFGRANPLANQFSAAAADRHMAKLAGFGINTLRLMVETPQSGNLEEPIGTFRPEHVKWLDAIVLAARKHDIKLIVTPWDTFWMNLRFHYSTYNPDLGGPLSSKIDFITSPRLRQLQKGRLQFLIDRWGNLGNIFAWELLNEADIWWGATPAQLSDWIAEMAGFVRDYEKKRWGRNHMISVSFAEPLPTRALALLALRSPHLDYATTHLYLGAAKAPKEPVGPAKAIRQGVLHNLNLITDRRPYLDTENGPIDQWISDPKLDDEVFHHMSWAHLASGAAGSGLRWPYRNPHHISEGMMRHLSVIRKFCDTVDWRKLAGERIQLRTAGDKGDITCGFATKEAALIWTTSGTVDISEVGQGTGAIRVFNCHTGQWERGITRQPNGQLEVVLPRAGSHAILIEFS